MRLKLKPGGVFDFDAVSQDKKFAACISTSGGKTATGKNAVGKLLKLRSDMLFLVMAEDLVRRMIVLTEPDMLEVCKREIAGGRIPEQIEFVLADLPEQLKYKLKEARQHASKEVSPLLWEDERSSPSGVYFLVSLFCRLIFLFFPGPVRSGHRTSADQSSLICKSGLKIGDRQIESLSFQHGP
ncbi:MAG: hypothetical protein C4576_33510 [Desulfobacteraceae bacterium]|nr:MAG: hypothetical protein C4576_33510 [Desulfobacteraceae bacterium]